MKRTPIDDNEKRDIGARIKRLRKEAGLRQWQLAELIGATQPAIHMYERGVLPEPKRLLELARIGNTTVEWILTGRHWENGSEEMHRVPEAIYHLAFLFKEYDAADCEDLESALEILRGAVGAMKEGEEPERLPLDDISRHLKGFSEGTHITLASALKIHAAVSDAVVSQATSRLRQSSLHGGHHDGAAGNDGADGSTDDGRKKR